MEVTYLPIDNVREVMPLPASSLPNLVHVELDILNLESTQGAPP